MADIADKAQPGIDEDLERRISAARGIELPTGNPGDCDECGVHYTRLVDGLCAGCREYLESVIKLRRM